MAKKDQNYLDVQESVNEIFTEDAAKLGVDVETHVENLKNEARMNPQSKAVATRLADLLNLIVIRVQEKTLLKSDMIGFAKSFFTEADADLKGNGKNFVKHFIKKAQIYDRAKFIPVGSDLDTEKFCTNTIAFKEANGTLKTSSKQVKFSYTFIMSEMITYFINGQLTEFVANQINSHINEAYVVWLYDFVMQNIKLETKGKVITDATRQDLFAALTEGLLPTVIKMQMNNAIFNNDQALTAAIDRSNKADLIMLVNSATYVKLYSNVQSQLYNMNNLNLDKYVGEVKITNNVFKFDQDYITTDPANEYVPENMIIVIDKRNYFKMIKMIEVSMSQDFAHNLARTHVLHFALASGNLDWGKKLIYKCEGFKKMPGQQP